MTLPTPFNHDEPNRPRRPRHHLRYFILGPVIIAMAFTLPSTAMAIAQIVAGIFYTSLGFMWLSNDRTEKRVEREEP